MTRKVFNEYLSTYVDVPDRVSRIVSLCPSITEVLALLGLDDEIVGISAWCKYLVPKFSNKLVICSYSNITDACLRRIKQVNPDVIFTTTGAQEKLVKTLLAHGFNVFPIPLPRNLFDIFKLIETVGMVVNKGQEIQELSNKLLDELLKFRNYLSRLKTLVILEFHNEYRTVGYFTHISSALRFIGLKNIFDNYLGTFIDIDVNYVNNVKPEVIIYDREPFSKIDRGEVITKLKNLGIDLDILSNAKLIIDIDLLKRYGPSFITHSLPQIISQLK